MPKPTKRNTEKRHPKPRDDGRGDVFAPGDRPDQVQIDAGDTPEDVDISFQEREPEDRRTEDRDEREPAPDTDDDADPEPVQPREQRTRDEEGNDAPLRSEGEEDEGQHARVQKRSRSNGHDDEEGEYSRRVQRRINREVALRKRTETQLADERAARQKLEQRISKIERTQFDEQGEASLKEIDTRMRQLAAELAKAKEDNNTAREVDLQIQLGDLQGEKVRLQARLDTDRADRTRRAQEETDAGAADPARERAATRGQSADWIRANRRWWNTARWKDARDDAITHDSTILEEINDGELEFEPYSDEHMEELSRRLKEDYPELELRNVDGSAFEDASGEGDEEGDERRDRMSKRDDHDSDDRGDRRSPSARAPMGGLGGREGRRERNTVDMARRGKVHLEDRDFQTMRIFKMDPKNPDHKKYFARERARTILGAANRGTRQ